MSNSSPEEIRQEIEQTRRDLASDVDNLHEKVSPSAVAGRKVESAKSAISNVKEKVMGGGDSSYGTSSSMGDKMSSVTDTASSAPDLARQKARGNPLAAGVIAFGAGWLVSSLIPASDKEQRAAMQVKDKASEHSETLTAPVKEAAQDMKANLQEPAQQAAASVKSTADDAAQTVKGEAQSAKDDISGSASSGQSSSSTDVNRPIGSNSPGI